MLTSLFSRSGILGMLYALPGILIALSFHEFAHAYAANRLGDPTARNLGRMTINPLAHIDLWGFIMLLLVRFGWAKPVPINPRNFKHPRRDELIVSLAGVVTNFLLAFVTMFLYDIIVIIAGGAQFINEALNSIIFSFFYINLGLFVFNLLPIPPLDGFHVAQCLFMRKLGTRPFEFLERYGFLLLIVLLMSGVLTWVLSYAVSGIFSGMTAVLDLLFSAIGVI